MYILDTDVLNKYIKGDAELCRRIDNTPGVFVCPITIYQAIRFSVATINKSHSPNSKLDRVRAFADFVRLLEALAKFPVAPYTPGAEVHFREIVKVAGRVGREDCLIAACAKANDCTVVTYNITDFRQTTLSCESW